MNLVFLGPPGAGKGTQAVEIARARGLTHISTGEILRAAIRDGTPTGLKAKQYVDKGELVPDGVVVDIVSEALAGGGSSTGWILDGFPRTLAQAKALESKTSETGVKGVEMVLYFAVPDEAVIKRLSGRRMCRACGASYHVDFMPPANDGVCDRCGGELYLRDDDKPQTVRNRLAAYREATEPLVDYYIEKGLLVEVKGDGGPETVRAAVEDILGERFC
ncbi:MAG TPA: adenylate kinase [Planctomycetes bacterium]|nr:adenylate kinase [Planctomycetota bacterium]